MKQSPLTTVLLVVLAFSALVSAGLCYNFIANGREVRTLQPQAAMVNNNRAMINALANDALEYSKKNPEINPILEAAGVKPAHSATGAAPARATTK